MKRWTTEIENVLQMLRMCFSNAFHSHPTAKAQARRTPRKRPRKGDGVKWARKAAAWRTGPGVGEGGKGLPAPLAAVALETAIQTLKKTALDCCVFTNL